MSIRASLINFMIRRTIKGQFDSIDEDVAAFRERMAESNKMAPKIPDEVKLEAVDANGVSCEWVTMGNADSSKVLLYFHGGGYVFGGLDSHRDLCWRLSEQSGARVLAVDYRLAPEHRFPGAVEDATTSYRWLLEQGYTADKIAIGGDSAGGGLAVATMLNLKNLGVKLPNCAILLSPWVDLSCSGDSIAANAKADPMLSPVAVQKFANLYLDDLDRKAPLASPLFADLTGLPPMLVHVGDTEILQSDAERLVNKINDAGGEAVLEVWPKMAHVFQVLASRIPEGKVAIEKLGEFIKQRLN